MLCLKLAKIIKLRPAVQSVVLRGENISIKNIDTVLSNAEYERYTNKPVEKVGINFEVLKANVMILKRTGKMGTLTATDLLQTR